MILLVQSQQPRSGCGYNAYQPHPLPEQFQWSNNYQVSQDLNLTRVHLSTEAQDDKEEVKPAVRTRLTSFINECSEVPVPSLPEVLDRPNSQ